jgi:hypothetical protein
MDIFKGVPPIDWSRFAQGSVSDPMWQSFMGLVKLCHCVEHWRNSSQSARRTRRPKPLYPESPHMRRKNQDEWDQPMKEDENRMHRAANLACENFTDMSHLAVDQGTPDWKLFKATDLSVHPSLGQTNARYKSIALEAFDSAELANTEPDVIASKWLNNAGYANQGPHL